MTGKFEIINKTFKSTNIERLIINDDYCGFAATNKVVDERTRVWGNVAYHNFFTKVVANHANITFTI